MSSIRYAESIPVVYREMFRLRNSEDLRRRAFCATVVLFAVCSLTASVATRYAFGRTTSSGVVTVHKHASPEPARQRLLKNAATWIPPVVCSVALEPPSSYPRIAPAGLPVSSLVLDENLYNRPPPSLPVLS